MLQVWTVDTERKRFRTYVMAAFGQKASASGDPEGAHLGSLQLQLSLALGVTPRRLLVLLQGQVGIRGSTSVGIG